MAFPYYRCKPFWKPCQNFRSCSPECGGIWGKTVLNLYWQRSSGATLGSVLGTSVVVFAVILLGWVALREGLVASQRTQLQGVLNDLNGAWAACRGAGVSISPSISPQEAVRVIGETAASQFSVGDDTYDLTYHETVGFGYVPRSGRGYAFGPSGMYAVAGKKEEAVGMTTAVAKKILKDFSMSRDLKNYSSLLEDINAAYNDSLLGAEDMMSAGLVMYGGLWMPPRDAERGRALDAGALLSGGASWLSVPEDLRRAYANVFPHNAVRVGGSEAIALISPSILSGDMVKGYAYIGGVWEIPLFISDADSPRYSLKNNGSISRAEPIYVYIQPADNSLQPPICVGRLLQAHVQVRGGYFYYWQADIPSPESKGLLVENGHLISGGSRFSYVQELVNGARDTNPWSDGYGDISHRYSHRLILSTTPPTAANL